MSGNAEFPMWVLGQSCLSSSSRRPRVSSSEMDRKMADRRMIRLSQLPERLAREKLEDSDWVTFAVVVNKTTQKSNSSVGVSLLPAPLPSWRGTAFLQLRIGLSESGVLCRAGEDLQRLEAE